MTKQIIDISKHNGVIDYKKLKDHVEHVFIRASLGYGTVDAMLEQHAKGVAAQGIQVSYYHFAYPDKKNGGTVKSDATAEANFFVSTISKLPKYENLVIDLENFTKDTDTTLNKAEYLEWLQAFLKTVKDSTGVDCVIYTYASYLNTHIPTAHNLGKYRLWIANYSAKTSPALPLGWSKYWMWQYSCTGEIDGISTAVDLNKLNTAK